MPCRISGPARARVVKRRGASSKVWTLIKQLRGEGSEPKGVGIPLRVINVIMWWFLADFLKVGSFTRENNGSQWRYEIEQQKRMKWSDWRFPLSTNSRIWSYHLQGCTDRGAGSSLTWLHPGQRFLNYSFSAVLRDYQTFLCAAHGKWAIYRWSS